MAIVHLRLYDNAYSPPFNDVQIPDGSTEVYIPLDTAGTNEHTIPTNVQYIEFISSTNFRYEIGASASSASGLWFSNIPKGLGGVGGLLFSVAAE